MSLNVTNVQGSSNPVQAQITPVERRQTEILDECEHFAKTVLNITADLRASNSTSRILPNFPKATLLAMMGRQPKPKAAVRGDELHYYLRSKIINLDPDVIMISTPTDTPGAYSWFGSDEIIDKLLHGYQILRTTHSKVFACSLIYGQWLQEAFKYVNNPRDHTGYRGKWEKWLKDNNINIKVSHARMLRTLAKKFYQYKRFRSLSIPLTEFWNKRKEIEEMLQNTDYANYWKG